MRKLYTKVMIEMHDAFNQRNMKSTFTCIYADNEDLCTHDGKSRERAYAHGEDKAEGYLGGFNWREKVRLSLHS